MAKQSPSFANSSLRVFSEFASNLLFYFCLFCFECGDVLVSESHPFCLEYLVGKNEVAKAGTFVEIMFRAIWTYKSFGSSRNPLPEGTRDETQRPSTWEGLLYQAHCC